MLSVKNYFRFVHIIIETIIHYFELTHDRSPLHLEYVCSCVSEHLYSTFLILDELCNQRGKIAYLMAVVVFWVQVLDVISECLQFMRLVEKLSLIYFVFSCLTLPSLAFPCLAFSCPGFSCLDAIAF